MMKPVKDMYILGLKANLQKHKEAEKLKKNILRAGSTGFQGDDGTFYGSAGQCPRRHYLRSIGVLLDDDETDEGNDLMFGAGRSNEDEWFKNLSAGCDEDIKILREEETPIAWYTANNTLVTGRPDIVFLDKNTNNAKGMIELKSIQSLWTAIDVILGKPKFVHLLQAAHYGMKLGCPANLWYTNRAIWPIKEYNVEEYNGELQGWAAVKLPKQGELGSECIEYIDKKDADGFIVAKEAKIKTFIRGFQMRWDSEGYLNYRLIPVVFKGVAPKVREWIQTPITWRGIERYFDFVSRIKEGGPIGSKPKESSANGDLKSYSACKYCPIEKVCKDKTLSDGINLEIAVNKFLRERDK